MFSPQTGYEGWSVFPEECNELALRQDCLDGMEAAIKRLRDIVATAPLLDLERQTLLYQLSHIQLHVRESVNMLVADIFLRKN